MGLLSFLSGAVKPVTELVDNLHTSSEEKLTLQNELVKLENVFTTEALQYEAKMMELQQNIIITEAKGESWIQRTWRPITMLTFLALIVAHYGGWLAFPIADQMWTVIKIGLGGYVGGRTLEKIVPVISSKFGKG
jgi:hypothetical protein